MAILRAENDDIERYSENELGRRRPDPTGYDPARKRFPTNPSTKGQKYDENSNGSGRNADPNNIQMGGMGGCVGGGVKIRVESTGSKYTQYVLVRYYQVG